MAQAAKDNRIVITGDDGADARTKLMEGAKASYDGVTVTFGPRGRNVLIEKPFGRPILTRDGVTVARDIYFSDRAKNMGAQYLLEASEITNRVAGDGTTATVALGYHLMREGTLAIASGTHPMEVKEILTKDSYTLLDALKKISKPTKKGQLQQVASVSSGDKLLGELIAGAIEHVGADGGIIAEKAPISDVEREYVDGYYLQQGFTALVGGKKELSEPIVIVSEKRFTTAGDVAEILTSASKAAGLKPGESSFKFLLIGNFEDGAYNQVISLINAQQIDAIIIKTPPQFGDMSKQLLEDIAIYAGCLPITEGMKVRDFSRSNMGMIDKVVASKEDATLFVATSHELVERRLQELKEQVALETVDALREKLRDRVAKLEGKVALFRIGGATDTAKEEKEFRVEDAIQATRAAAREGVVPGGATTLLELSKCDISPMYQRALHNVFKQLLVNAGLKAEVKLDEALAAPKGHGFNLRGDGKLVDMTEVGVLDPTLVVQQVITNATDTAANMLTAGALLIFENLSKVE